MKNLIAIQNLLSITVFGIALSACTIEPIHVETKEVIKGAPDWVNTGSTMRSTKDARLFHGVSSAPPQGDRALQKSIADDRSVIEVGGVLSSYFDVVANSYIASGKSVDYRENREYLSRQFDETATRQVDESIKRQIDEAILHQFKETVTQKVKDSVAQQIKEDSARQYRETIAAQVDLARQIDEAVTCNIREAVSRQIKSTIDSNTAGARNIGSWNDPRTYSVWSISELDLEYVKNTVAGKSDMNADLKEFFKLHADDIFDKIIQDQNNPNPFTLR